MSNIYNAIKNNITQEQIVRNITKDIIDSIENDVEAIKANSKNFIVNSTFEWTLIDPNYDYDDYSLSNVHIPDPLITAYENSYVNGQRDNEKY